MLKKVAVVIPFYRDEISYHENIALKQCERILSGHDIIAVKPRQLTLPAEANQVKFSSVVSFDDSYFKGIAGYNKLMLSSDFYSEFLDYEYVLIYQMDAFVFKDVLSYWCGQGYDYIGAPWIKKTYHKSAAGLLLLKVQNFFRRFQSPKKASSIKYQVINKVGNGGFSLRRVAVFNEICKSMQTEIQYYLSHTNHFYNEDVFWSMEVNKEKKLLNIPDCNTALKFAFEVPPIKNNLLNNNNQPFGCHDWDRYLDYWRPVFKKDGYSI